jgi:hypothetical protein
MSKRNLHQEEEIEQTFDEKANKWESLTRGDWKWEDRPKHRFIIVYFSFENNIVFISMFVASITDLTYHYKNLYSYYSLIPV